MLVDSLQRWTRGMREGFMIGVRGHGRGDQGLQDRPTGHMAQSLMSQGTLANRGDD